MPVAVLTLLLLTTAFWAGCSNNDNPMTHETPSTIDVLAILVNPLSPTPGGTVQLTAQVEGSGAAATYEWTVSGGTLNENGKINVSWTVPDQSNVVYRVSVRGASGTAVDTLSTYVMVRNLETINTGLRYAMYPQLIGGQLYYAGVNKNPADRDFRGYHVYKNVLPPTPIDTYVFPPIDGGYEFLFSSDAVVTSSVINGADYLRQQSINLYYFPLGAGSKRAISNSEIGGQTYRKNQHVHPSASSDFNMFVWQYNKPGAFDDGTRDLVNIKFRSGISAISTLTNSTDSTWVLGGWSYKYFRNIAPMFSPDNGTIIYFVDSTGTFEPCVIPMDGTEPLVDERRALMVSSRHGIFFNAGVSVNERIVFQWNPAIPTQVGFIDGDRKMCIFDYVAETVEVVAEGIAEFVWSADGKVAGITSEGVYVLDPGQADAKRIFAKERSSDDIIGVNWSPGLVNQRLGFRVVRKGKSSMESFAALVNYSMDADRWYYASGQIKPPASAEPKVSYPWLRVLFDPASDALIAPVPIASDGGKVVLYRSY
jgi:hypothetical protein